MHLVPIELAGAAALDIAAPLESQVFRGLSSSRVVLLVFFVILAGVGLAIVSARSRPVAAREIAFSEVLSLVDAGRVRALNVYPETVTVELGDGQRLTSVSPPGYVAANPTFITTLAAKHVVVRVVSTTSPYQYSGTILGIVAIIMGAGRRDAAAVDRCGGG